MPGITLIAIPFLVGTGDKNLLEQSFLNKFLNSGNK